MRPRTRCMPGSGEQSSAINVSTVYRTLEVLEELGLVRHAHLSDRAPTYHSVTDHEHFHLVCKNSHRACPLTLMCWASFRERLRARSTRLHRGRSAT